MSYVTNGLDGTHIYFEDDGGQGVPVVLHGGFLDGVADVRESNLAQSLPNGEFRTIYVDHRGLGRSDKSYEPGACAMRRRVTDAVTVLDELAIGQAHFIGMSWGGRLAFGMGQRAPERVLSLVVLGQQPYGWPDSQLTRAVTEGLVVSRTRGAVGVVEALEAFWGVQLPNPRRARWLDNDPAALEAAWTTVLAEGAGLRQPARLARPLPDLHRVSGYRFHRPGAAGGGGDPGARFVALAAADHYQAHVSEDAVLLDAVLDMLRVNS